MSKKKRAQALVGKTIKDDLYQGSTFKVEAVVIADPATFYEDHGWVKTSHKGPTLCLEMRYMNAGGMLVRRKVNSRVRYEIV